MKRIFLLVTFVFTFIWGTVAGENAHSANSRFWVGGSGNWNDINHWSTLSGGASGASVPSFTNDVIFDSRSFITDGDGVFIDGSVKCHSMLWEDLKLQPILSGPSSSSLHIYGSLVFARDMSNQFRGKILFNSSSKKNTIVSANRFFVGDVVFDNEKGEWKLLDDIRTLGKASIQLISGTLLTNDKNINCNAFLSAGVAVRSLILGSSNIIVRDKWNIANASNFVLDAGTSSIILPKEKSAKTFAGGNLRYNQTPVTMGNCSPSGDGCTFGFTITLTNTPDSCNGGACNGTVKAVIAGGVGPFTYLWDDPASQTTATATGLCIGPHLVQVTDGSGNTCTCFDNVTSPPTLNSLPITQTSATCNGLCNGTATAAAFGGVSPYSYLWSPTAQTSATATGLCGTVTYTVTITDSYKCTSQKTKTITQPTSVVANGSSTSLACFNVCTGTAGVAPTGGTPPYTYAWLPGGATTSALSSLCTNTYSCTVTDANNCTATYSTTLNQPTQLTTTVTGTNLLCNGVCTGSVTASSSGGTGAYTYSWAPGGCTTSACTGLCAATYTLTLTDANNCSLTKTITLTQPGALTTAPTGTNISCFGVCDGIANANAGSGTSPYTYSWVPGGCTTSSCSTLCANTYTVNVTDANGCAGSGIITLTQPALLTATMTKTDVVCPGFCNGIANATPAGGTAPYTYSWSPGGQTTSSITGQCVGTYTCTVTDSHTCVATGNITINMPSPLLPNITKTNVSCFGACDGTVKSTATGGTPGYTYSWNPGGYTTSAVSSLCANNYTLNLTDANGCPVTSTVSVTQPATFSVSITANPNPLNCNGDCNGTALANVVGGTPTYTYAWSTGATTPSVTGLCAGPYTLNCTDANGCPANANVTFLQPSTLSVTIASSNPSCNGSCDGTISAIGSGGTPAYTFSWQPGGQTTSVIGSQCAGTYTLTATDSKGCSNVQIVTLTGPSLLAANASVVNNISCSGLCDGSVASVPSGGTAPFTYAWSGGQTTQNVTGLCASTVTVTVTDANGCGDIDIITITQPGVLSSSIGATTSSCSLCNGTSSVSTSGGTTPYTFLWSPGGQTTSAAVGLCVGNYTVDVTDANGCANTLTVTINPVVIITISVSGTTVSCPGSCDGIATATPSGGTIPYTYQWSTAPLQLTPSATGLCAGTYTVTVGDMNGCASTSTITFTAPAALTTTMSATSASCGLCNGTATVAAGGGTGAYTYSWSGFPVQTTTTATGLCSGNYTVTLKDANNCSTTNTVTVGNTPTISDNASTTLTACTGNTGAICVSPTGGTPGYTYSWAPGGSTISCITGLAAGVYTVTISDNAGCSVPFPIALSNTSGPTVTVTSAINPACNANCDGSISVSAAGVNPPFTYLWNPGGQTTTSISALCAGTYIVQVDDNVPCSTFSSTTLTDPAQLTANPTVTNVSCNGGNNGNICLSPAGGNAPYTYKWLPGGQTTSCRAALIAGTYSVVVTDNTGCDDTVSIPVTEPLALNISMAFTDVTCNGNGDGTATATVTGGTTLYTYAWSTGSPLPNIVGLIPNTYSLTVTDSKGCSGTATVTISQPAVLTTTTTSTNMSCNAVCDGTASITASGGTVAYTYSWLPGGETTSAITGLCVGNYVGTVTDAHGCASTKTVTISQPAVISTTVTSTNATCFGVCDGSASASSGGGTGAYTYQWNPGALTGSSITGLCATSYTLVTSDANGCNVTNLFSISAPLVLQANITNTQTSCTSTCDGTATSSPVGGTPPYTYSWSNGSTTAGITGLCAATFTLTLSDSKNCSVIQTTTIPSPPPLTQSNSITGATCLQCNGSISLIGSGGTAPYSFFWSTGATTATITGLCAGVYIDTVMDSNGCMSFDTIGLSNTTGPTITLCKSDVTCFGACDGTASVCSVAGNGPPWVYLWSFASGTLTTQSITGLCPQQYFATVTDINGCKTVMDTTIFEPAQLAPNLVSTNATCFGICNGSVTSSATGGTGAYTYSWLPGAQTTASITAQCAGNYTLTLKDANNCSNTTTITIGQNTLVTNSVTTTANTCNASCDGSATITVTGGTLPYTYLWMPGSQTTSAATALCANNYTISANDAIGCISNNTVTVSEPAVLAANTVSVDPSCNGSCDGSISSAPTGGTAPYTYLWAPGNLTTTSVTGLCAGTLTLTVTDSHTCTITNTITLTDPAVLSSTDVEVNTSCANTCDGTITLTPTGGTPPYTFLWSPGGQTTQNISALCAGIDSVLITDSHGCTFKDSMTIGITTLVISNAGNDTTFCVGGTASLTSSSTNATSVHWYQLPAWSSVGVLNTVNVSPLTTTNYALVAMNGICADTDYVSVIVNSYPVIVPSNDTTICSGDSATLCTSGASAYQWYTLPAWTPLVTGSCITVSPAVGTTYYGVIGMNGTCNSTKDSVAVTVLAMPVANAGADVSVCFGTNTTLCSTSLNATSVTWYQVGSPLWTKIDTTICITVNPAAGINIYGLIASNGICSDTDSVSVTVYPPPAVDAGPNVTILSSASTILNGTGNGTYAWSPPSTLSSATDANPTANPSTTTTYTLVVTDTSGCTAFDTVKVTVVSNVIPSDGLSPNGDGINDVWTIPGIEAFPNALVEVYNRWGELIFHSIGYSKKWDATYNGKELPVGTYYYIINLNNSALFKDPISGPITILR